MKDRPIPRRVRVASTVAPVYNARQRPVPSVDLLQQMVETGEAWRRDDWTSRYAAALVAVGACER